MAKLEITLSKEQHEALDDSLKGYYVATQDGKGFELEGIGSIQRAFEAEKAKKATKPELLTEVEELRKFKAEQEAAATKAEQDQLVKKGEFEAAQAARDAEWQKRLDAATAQSEATLANLKREKLTNMLVEKGALPERAKYLINDLDGQLDLVSGEDGFSLKKKGGIGDAVELDAIFEGVKTQSPFFFASDNASGSGASGSQGGGASAKTISRAEYDKNPVQYAKDLASKTLTITD